MTRNLIGEYEREINNLTGLASHGFPEEQKQGGRVLMALLLRRQSSLWLVEGVSWGGERGEGGLGG